MSCDIYWSIAKSSSRTNVTKSPISATSHYIRPMQQMSLVAFNLQSHLLAECSSNQLTAVISVTMSLTTYQSMCRATWTVMPAAESVIIISSSSSKPASIPTPHFPPYWRQADGRDWNSNVFNVIELLHWLSLYSKPVLLSPPFFNLSFLLYYSCFSSLLFLATSSGKLLPQM